MYGEPSVRQQFCSLLYFRIEAKRGFADGSIRYRLARIVRNISFEKNQYTNLESEELTWAVRVSPLDHEGVVLGKEQES